MRRDVKTLHKLLKQHSCARERLVGSKKALGKVEIDTILTGERENERVQCSETRIALLRE